MAKVLISDDLSPRAAEILAARGIEVDMLPGIGADELNAGSPSMTGSPCARRPRSPPS